MRTRRDMKSKNDDQKDNLDAEEEVDINLDDPEVQAATERIQAGYKGMCTRRELKDKQGKEEKEKTLEK